MRSGLSTRPRPNMVMNFVPIFAKFSQSFEKLCMFFISPSSLIDVALIRATLSKLITTRFFETFLLRLSGSFRAF